MRNLKIFGLGHSNQSISEFITKLKNHQIELVVDVRTYPLSRYSPHFSKSPFKRELERALIKYTWRGNSLGGRGININHDVAIKELIELAKTGTRVAVVCAERDFLVCHRHLVIRPALANFGVTIEEI
jgi:uncharacterized protein (DUF488 family)